MSETRCGALSRSRLHGDEPLFPVALPMENHAGEYKRHRAAAGLSSAQHFDATPFAEFLYECVHESVSDILPAAVSHVERVERFRVAAKAKAELPWHMAILLFPIMYENGGKLPARHPNPDFPALSPDQARAIDECYASSFAKGASPDAEPS